MLSRSNPGIKSGPVAGPSQDTHHLLTQLYLGAVYSHPFNLICMFLDCGKKPRESEYKNSTQKGPEPRYDPRTFLLRGDCANHCTTVQKAFLLSNVWPITRTTWLWVSLLLGSVSGYIYFGLSLFPFIHKGGTVKEFSLISSSNEELLHPVAVIRILWGLNLWDLCIWVSLVPSFSLS